mgnify:CR=1 FL=1
MTDIWGGRIEGSNVVIFGAFILRLWSVRWISFNVCVGVAKRGCVLGDRTCDGYVMCVGNAKWCVLCRVITFSCFCVDERWECDGKILEGYIYARDVMKHVQMQYIWYNVQYWHVPRCVVIFDIMTKGVDSTVVGKLFMDMVWVNMWMIYYLSWIMDGKMVFVVCGVM